MAQVTEERLKKLEIILPYPNPSVGAYLPFIKSGHLLFISGQIPLQDGKIIHPGKVGQEVDVESAKSSARLCGLHILTQAKAALGDLDRIKRCIKLGGFVACTPSFTEHPKILNAASDLMLDVFQEKGPHVRFAVGASSLPLNACVEVEAIFEVE